MATPERNLSRTGSLSADMSAAAEESIATSSGSAARVVDSTPSQGESHVPLSDSTITSSGGSTTTTISRDSATTPTTITDPTSATTDRRLSANTSPDTPIPDASATDSAVPYREAMRAHALERLASEAPLGLAHQHPYFTDLVLTLGSRQPSSSSLDVGPRTPDRTSPDDRYSHTVLLGIGSGLLHTDPSHFPSGADLDHDVLGE